MDCKRLAQCSQDEDRISHLPSELIDRILQHFTVREKASLSILSTRWRNFWYNESELILNKEFYKQNFSGKPKDKISSDFLIAVKDILFLHCGAIRKFGLYVPGIIRSSRHPEIDKLILVLSRKDVKELSIQNSSSSPYKLPSYIFSCSQLTALDLTNCVIDSKHALSCFPKLQKLYLHNMTVSSQLAHVIVPENVESLVIDSCIFGSISFCKTSKLTSLQLLFPSHHLHVNLPFLVGFNFIKPKLKWLYIDGCFLEVGIGKSKIFEQGMVASLNALDPSVESWPLVGLIVKEVDVHSNHLCRIMRLLRNLRNLQVLKIHLVDRMGHDFMGADRIKVSEEQKLKDLKLDQLKTLRWHFSSVSGIELSVFKSLLVSCRALEEVKVLCKGFFSWEKHLEITKCIMQFPRASPKAVVTYEHQKSD